MVHKGKQSSVIRELHQALEDGGAMSSMTVDILRELLNKQSEIKRLQQTKRESLRDSGEQNNIRRELKKLDRENRDLQTRLSTVIHKSKDK